MASSSSSSYSGTLGLQLPGGPGVNPIVVEAAVMEAIATFFDVTTDHVSVTATESRRLEEASARKLAGYWTVGYTLTLLADKVTSAEAKMTNGAVVTSSRLGSC